MNLHGEVMNIECVIPEHLDNDAAVRMAYRVGHRDARHAAAELALKADATIAELLVALKSCWDLGIDKSLVPMVSAAIQSAEGTKP